MEGGWGDYMEGAGEPIWRGGRLFGGGGWRKYNERGWGTYGGGMENIWRWVGEK